MDTKKQNNIKAAGAAAVAGAAVLTGAVGALANGHDSTVEVEVDEESTDNIAPTSNHTGTSSSSTHATHTEQTNTDAALLDMNQFAGAPHTPAPATEHPTPSAAQQAPIHDEDCDSDIIACTEPGIHDAMDFESYSAHASQLQAEGDESRIDMNACASMAHDADGSVAEGDNAFNILDDNVEGEYTNEVSMDDFMQ